MKKEFLIGVFDCDEKVLEATKKAVDKHFEIYDVYTPFPVHGLDSAMGIKRSFLPYVTFAAGAMGFLIAILFQIWTSAIDWPTIIGGKPFISFPAFVPITFEITVLLAAHTTVAAFLASNFLFPGKQAMILHPEQTCNKFIMAFDKTRINKEDVTNFLNNNGAISVEEKSADNNCFALIGKGE